MKDLGSLLLFALLAASLLFLALGASDEGGLHQLSNHSLLVFLVLSHHGLPHFVDFALPSRLRFVLHFELLPNCLFLKIMLSDFLVFISHLLALFPLHESFSVVFGLVASQIVLDLSGLVVTQTVKN